MYLARILFPVKVLGPGNRIGIWFDGCTHACKGCSNPELWDRKDRYKTDAAQVMKLVNSIAGQYHVDGFTITGGDPLEQPEALRELLPMLAEISGDILLYTGFEYSRIKDEYKDILAGIAVLIDGLYVEELNREELLRGSSNQNIWIINDIYRAKYIDYLTNHVSEIQNFAALSGTISVGIHRPGYEQELDVRLKKKGLESNE